MATAFSTMFGAEQWSAVAQGTDPAVKSFFYPQ